MGLRGALLRPRAKAPVPLVSRYNSGGNWGGMVRSADMNALMDTMETQPAVFGVVDKISSGVAGQGWHLYRKAASGKPEDRVEVTSHGILDLLNNPNPLMSRQELFQAGQQHQELVGEVDLVVGRTAGIKYPTELWPAMPQRLTPQPDPDVTLAGWWYRTPDGQELWLDTFELVRRRRPHPRDLFRGISWIQPLLTSLDADEFANEWQRSFYLNSAQPGGVVTVDRRLGDEEFEEMLYRWREQHQGVNKAHRVALLEFGASYTPTPLTHVDMQFSEMTTAMRDKILLARGFPKSVLGVVEDVNRANAEAMEYLFAKWITDPELQAWREMLNGRLLPQFGQDVARRYELDYDSPVSDDNEQAMKEIQTKSTAYVALVKAGADSAATEEYLDLPDLGYEKPEPAPIAMPPAGRPPQPGTTPDDPAQARAVEAANRWVAEAHLDDHTCDPCRDNDGKLYHNREDAYKDYPGGQGYRKCVGAEFGNQCRCSVVKRRKS